MKPSESMAAKQPKLNASLSKLFGQPKDLSNMTGGRTTQGDSRAEVNSNIVNNKYGESPNDYGRGV
jgi:hypothetical protein